MNSMANLLTKHYLMLLWIFILGLAWSVIPHPLVVIGISVLPIAILVMLHYPFLMVLLFVIFSFFRIHEVIPQLYNFKIPLLLSLASFATLGWNVFYKKRFDLWWRPELTALSAFFVAVSVGVVMASNMPIAIQYYLNIFVKIAIMCFAITWLTTRETDFTFAAKAIVLAGCVVGIKALHNKANGIGLVEETRVTIGRVFGSVLGDPNDLSLVLMFPSAFAVGFILTKGLSNGLKVFGLISICTLFSAILATQSRGGLLGILAVFGIYAYRRIQNKLLFLGGGAIAALILYQVAGISGRASGGAAEAGIDASAMGRIYAWEAAIGMANDNPLTGVGIDNFYSNYFFYSPHWDGLNHAVHSTWFGVLAETGYLGLIIFITLIVMLVKTNIRTLALIESFPDRFSPAINTTAEALLAGLIGTLAAGTFLTFGFSWPIYILGAMTISLAHWTEQQWLPHTVQQKDY